MPIKSVMPSKHLILCYPLLLLSSNFPSIQVFSNESVLCTRWSKYWSFSFNSSPSNEYLRLISFRIDWFDLLVFPYIPKMVEHYDSCFKPLQDEKAKRKIINVHSKFSRSSRRTKIWQNQKTISMIILFYLGHPHLIHPFKTNFTEIYYELHNLLSFPGKESIWQCRRCKFDPWVRKIPWKRNGNLLQYSCLGNPMH